MKQRAWLSPKGKLVWCQNRSHWQKASDILATRQPKNLLELTEWSNNTPDAEQVLEGEGWWKLTNNKWYGVSKPTQQQIDVMFDMGVINFDLFCTHT